MYNSNTGQYRSYLGLALHSSMRPPHATWGLCNIVLSTIAWPVFQDYMHLLLSSTVADHAAATLLNTAQNPKKGQNDISS